MLAAIGASMRPALGTLALAACAAQSASPLVAPTRPPLPEGWAVLEGPQGDVRMAVPPDMSPIDAGHSLIVQSPIDAEAGRVTLEVTASPPAIVLDQPEIGQSVHDWLEDYISRMGPPPEIAVRGPTSTRQVGLPTGPALEMRTSFSADGPDDGVVVYAIRTTAGFGLLQVLGQQPTIESRSEDLRLMTLLLEFGPAD